MPEATTIGEAVSGRDVTNFLNDHVPRLLEFFEILAEIGAEGNVLRFAILLTLCERLFQHCFAEIKKTEAAARGRIGANGYLH